MSKITGYGRGWQEPKAKTIVGRVMQRLREPATTTDYVAMSIVFAGGMILIIFAA